MATDLSNWSLTKEADVFQKTERHPFGDAADKKKQKINITVDKSTGDFSVSATGVKQGGLEGFPKGEDIPIFGYSGNQNSVYIINKKYFNAMFKGTNGRNDIFKNIKKQTKRDILALAERSSNTTTGLNILTNLKSTEAYKSVANVVDTPPQTIVAGSSDNSTTESDSEPTTYSSANKAVPPIDMGTLSSSDFKLATVESETGGDQSSESEGAQYFRYPEGRIPNLGYDYIQITSYKYVAGLSIGAGSTDVSSYIRTTGTDKNQTTSGKSLAQQAENIIQLPMIGGLSESTSVSWNSDTLSEIQLIAGNIAYSSITGGGNPLEAVLDALKKVVSTAQEGLMDDKTKEALMAYFAGQAASAPNFSQRATGKKINNNMELLFNGPQLRTFNFSFKLRPRTESESILCRNIIKSLKRDSAPKTSTTNLFLETPNIFLLEYIYQAQDGVTPSYTQHPFLNLIKPCALKSINVNYTPDGSYMTYETNGSMIGYDLNLTFQEIEPIYRSDQEAEYKRDNMGY